MAIPITEIRPDGFITDEELLGKNLDLAFFDGSVNQDSSEIRPDGYGPSDDLELELFDPTPEQLDWFIGNA